MSKLCPNILREISYKLYPTEKGQVVERVDAAGVAVAEKFGLPGSQCSEDCSV